MTPGYLKLHERGVLAERIRKALDILNECDLCPRQCRVDRIEGEKGVCRTERRAVVSSYNAHFGEESPLVGRGGSGTIFFTHCNLLCLFCQNYEISHLGEGREVVPKILAGMMIALQRMGCHNINFVSPSHVIAQILEALPFAIDEGLNVPLVYNTGGYDSVSSLELLDGIVDIYMPDVKFFDSDVAGKFCNAPDYPDVVKAALKEMHRQVGNLTLNEEGIAERGLLVRHLVMPGGSADTGDVTAFLAKEISPDTYINIMDQYRPCGEARRFPKISRRITQEEYRQALDTAQATGLRRLDNRERRIFRLF